MGDDCTIQQCHFGGDYTHAAVQFRGRLPTMIDCKGWNSNSAGRGAVQGAITAMSRALTHPKPLLNVPLGVGSRASLIPDLQLEGLNGFNARDPKVFAKNLGGMASVTQGVTSHPIAFQGQIAGATNGLNTVSATGSGNSLPAGTYVYALTVLDKYGETGIGDSVGDWSMRQVTVAAGQRVDVTWYGSASTSRPIRIYRRPSGSASSYDGYWQITSGSSFSDTGAVAFTGRDSPQRNWAIPSRHEANANYAIVATPSWATTVHVTNKATSGFTLNFGTAAPAGATVQWLLFRP
jgi:hypothetical protein